MAGSESVDTWIAALDADTRALVEHLRTLALAARPGVTEHIKWNAPSFYLNGDDRITLGVERKGGIRVVLHRGAKVKDASGFAFADPDKLAKWPSADRGVMTFATAADVAAREVAIADIFTRWLAATA